MIGNAAGFDAGLLAFGEHFVQRVHIDFKGDMQVIIMLVLELKWLIWRFKESKERAVVHPVESVQHLRLAPRFGFANCQGIGQRQAQKILVKLPGFFRAPASVGIMVKSLDHDIPQ